MSNKFDSLAGHIFLAVGFLFLGGIVVFTLGCMVYYVWTVPRQSSARLHQIVKNGKNVSAKIVGLVVADILFWLTRSASAPDVSFNEWLALIGAVNI